MYATMDGPKIAAQGDAYINVDMDVSVMYVVASAALKEVGVRSRLGHFISTGKTDSGAYLSYAAKSKFDPWQLALNPQSARTHTRSADRFTISWGPNDN